MQIDKPDGDELRIHTDVIFVEPVAPLPPEPPPTALEPERVLTHERRPLLERRFRIHPRSLVGMALFGGGAIVAVVLAVAAVRYGAKHRLPRLGR